MNFDNYATGYHGYDDNIYQVDEKCSHLGDYISSHEASGTKNLNTIKKTMQIIGTRYLEKIIMGIIEISKTTTEVLNMIDKAIIMGDLSRISISASEAILALALKRRRLEVNGSLEGSL